ncbi:MAG: 50S ribosomal protein L17 [Spirochaetes bacterium]|nr:MAG: 50S ribosomal protein L17 [Spirochaetota bacterium]
MRHKNSVRQLGRTHSHRKAMFSNMVTSLLQEERIVTTKQKGRELKKISEKLITRAKNNLSLAEAEAGKKLHNKRMVMRIVKNRDVVKKLFEDIAIRFQARNGGYTRLYLLGRRPGDAAEMAIVELVERKAESAKGADKSKEKTKKKKEPKESKEK